MLLESCDSKSSATINGAKLNGFANLGPNILCL